MRLGKTFRHLFHPQRSNNHRPKILHPEALVILSVAVVGFWLSMSPVKFLLSKTGNVLGFASDITATEVVQQTNVQREKLGLPDLTVNDKLNQAALSKAQNMYTKQYWAHVAPDGTQPWKFFQDANYQYSVAGENLARDFSTTPDMMAAWMASPTHRANIVNAKYKEIGVAVVDGKLLGTETTLVVQLFGAPLSGAPQISDQAKTTNAPSRITFVPESPAPHKAANAQGSAPAGTQPNPAFAQNTQNPENSVLSSTVLPITSLNDSILLSPLQVIKAFFLAIIFVVVMTLVYDSFIMSRRSTIRLVGKNFAHVMLLGVVAFLVIFFKGGIVGTGISF